MDNAEQIGTVIDKIADKLGVAVESLEPLAKTVVAEFRMQAIFGAIIYGLVGLVGLWMIWNHVWKPIRSASASDEDLDDNKIGLLIAEITVFAIIGCISVLIGLVAGVSNIKDAAAPTYYLIEKLVG